MPGRRAMRGPRVRFTIRSLMIAIGVMAVLLILPSGWGITVIALSLSCLILIAGQWLVFRGHRHLAAFGFWFLAILINGLYAAACIAPNLYLLILVLLGWLVIVISTIMGLGAAWATLSTREGAVPRRSIPAAWSSFLGLAVLPALTLSTFWPLHIAFLTARPTLELLADQVAAGQAAGFPQRAGLFRLAGSAVDPVSGNVGL
jgi:hypothetical protein